MKIEHTDQLLSVVDTLKDQLQEGFSTLLEELFSDHEIDPEDEADDDVGALHQISDFAHILEKVAEISAGASTATYEAKDLETYHGLVNALAMYRDEYIDRITTELLNFAKTQRQTAVTSST